MVRALIFAGGAGQRMNTKSKPKQFLEMHGKPILIYTLEHFQCHEEVDDIVVVCLREWIPTLRRFLKIYMMDKVTKIIPGGGTGHDSVYYGLKAMAEDSADDDIVLIHDGVRPLINADLISKNIATAKDFGNAITVEPARESVIRCTDGKTFTDEPNRNEMYIAKAPQTFRFGDIYKCYNTAEKRGIKSIDSSHLCSMLNVRMHIVRSTSNNLKITEPVDYYIYRALYDAMENEQIFIS